MPVPDVPWRGVVPVLLAALDVVLRRRHLGEHAGRVLVRRVVQAAAPQDANGGHPQVFNPRIESEAVVRTLLILVIVDVRVAWVPSARSEARPAPQGNVDGHGAAGWGVYGDVRGHVLRAPLDSDPGLAPGNLDAEGAVRIEERFAGADLQDGVGRVSEAPRGVEHLDAGLDPLA